MNLNKFKIISIIMLMLLTIPSVSATVTNITPSEDTFSYIFEPDTNMGGNTEVSVWNYYGRQSAFAYIKFANISGTGSPNIPSNSNINSATMWLYTRAGESQTITFYTPSASWTESSLTWNNQPSPVTPYASVAQDGSTAHWTSVDVTNIVRKWNDGTITNNGLVALSDGGGASASTDWRSKENKTNKPYISVDYTAPPYTIAYNFLGILPPIRTDGSSIFNLGRTVPVKFRIADANGNYVSTATASLTYQKITDEILGNVEEAVSTSAAREGNTFRYDSTDNLYIFNLGTEGMSTGTYQLNINLDDGTVHTVLISLR